MRKLYALLAGLCISLVSIKTIAQTPTQDIANFTFTIDASSNIVTFTNTSTIGDIAGTRQAIWSFGDGSSQLTGLHDGTKHQYLSAGTYTVCLKIFRFISGTADSVLSAQECKTVVIQSICAVDFEYKDSLAHVDPLKHLVHFRAIPYNSSGTYPAEICWKFGDGTDTCITLYPNVPPTNPLAIQHTYYQQGPYNVCVRIKYSNGCVAEKCKQVTLQNIPSDSCKADFEKISLTVSNNALYTSFKALPWHNYNKKPARICWNFGDGKDTCIQYSSTFTGLYTVNHLYTAPGTFQVCLKILYNGGCEAGTCRPIIIGRPDSCSIDFEKLPITTTANPLKVIYKALPWNNHNKRPARICWNFGDGKDTCISYNYRTIYTRPYTVAHTYRESGNYEVCIKVLYYDGCESHTCKHIQIGSPDSCTADFQRVPVTSTNDSLRIYFKALPWDNNQKKPAAICWTFGDGRDTCIKYEPTYTGTYAIPHRYKEAGSYEVCVKIIYYGGCESKKCKIIVVESPDRCSADFEQIPTTNASLRTYFRALPKHNNNKKPERICWKFGDGTDTCIKYGTDFSGQYVVGHNYLHPGLYEVCVSILYAGGCESKICKSIRIGEPDSCRANFETISVASNALRKYFVASPWHNHNKKPVYICWKFGDGKDTCIQYSTSFTGPYAVGHNYNNAGQYEVCVRIVYDGGCESKECKLIQVGEPDSCSADFERAPIQDNDSLTIGLKALPWNSHNHKPARICWYFGDGKDTCINYPENYTGLYVIGYRYHQTGSYEVCIKILYYGGCEAKKCKVITIPPIETKCEVKLFEITPSITSLVRGFFASPSSSPTRRPERICWSFGDGKDTCVMVDPASTNQLSDFFIRHTYPGPGVYKACVKVLFSGGCIAYDCKEVAIRGFSNVCGGYMIDSLIAPRTFAFKGFSIHQPNDEVVGYWWSFGDGSTATAQEVKHTYNVGGTYEVCLTIKTRLGCETRICKAVRVPGNNEPVLHLSPNPVIHLMHVEFFSTHTEQVSIKIVNSSGIAVRSYVRNVTVGSNSWDLDLSSLLPGVYSFVLQSPNQLASAIFLKAN